MSPKDAYEALVANHVDYVPLDRIKGRISATLALIYPPGIGVIVPGERWDERAQPMLDYFLAFEDSFNEFPGFNYEVQGVFRERVEGRIKFHTYVVREVTAPADQEAGGLGSDGAGAIDHWAFGTTLGSGGSAM
jgi:ornithine decarboxylase